MCSYDDGYNGMPSSCIKTSLVRVFGIKLIFRVEFQSKFFKGNGKEFIPFSFKNAIEEANAWLIIFFEHFKIIVNLI